MNDRMVVWVISICVIVGMVAAGVAGIAMAQLRWVPQLVSPPLETKAEMLKKAKPLPPTLPVTIDIQTSDMTYVTVDQTKGTFTFLHLDSQNRRCYRASGPLKSGSVKGVEGPCGKIALPVTKEKRK